MVGLVCCGCGVGHGFEPCSDAGSGGSEAGSHPGAGAERLPGTDAENPGKESGGRGCGDNEPFGDGWVDSDNETCESQEEEQEEDNDEAGEEEACTVGGEAEEGVEEVDQSAEGTEGECGSVEETREHTVQVYEAANETEGDAGKTDGGETDPGGKTQVLHVNRERQRLMLRGGIQRHGDNSGRRVWRDGVKG